MATNPASSRTSSKATPPSVGTPAPRKPVRTLHGDPAVAEDNARKATVALYESALKLLQAGKYEKAHEAFVAMMQAAPPQLAASIRSNIAICVAQLQKQACSFGSNEERYDFAVSLINQGHYEDAREHLNAIRQANRNSDYAFYGLAVLASITGDTDSCIDHLTEAIRLNGQNRLQARMDSDFEPVNDDPRFTELLYPES